ncbi:hypothetical protein [Streptomyces sp. NBC_01268]|uniref:hypothetical protein n=1 Tax=Streptomyces sp. NBC_01268 TaxID=2903806 RepID=UPI002E2F4C00|nr:hypothetical protein [Streptomyces sp. NBC_01268]
MPLIVPRFESMRYDGTNGDEIVAWLNGSVDLVLDDGEQLIVNFIGSNRTILVGGWVIAGGTGAGRGFYTEQAAADYANGWAELPA